MSHLKMFFSLGLFLVFSFFPGLASSHYISDGDYQVEPGDSLWSIAAHDSILGNPWLWPLLYDANQDVIDSPDHILSGSRLTMAVAPSASDRLWAVAYARYYSKSYHHVPDTTPSLVAKTEVQPSDLRETKFIETAKYINTVMMILLLGAITAILLAIVFLLSPLALPEGETWHALAQTKGQPHPFGEDSKPMAEIDVSKTVAYPNSLPAAGFDLQSPLAEEHKEAA